MKNHKYSMEEIQKVHKLFLEKSINDIAKEMNLTWGNIYSIVYWLRKHGVKLERKSNRLSLDSLVSQYAKSLKK